eukprot:8333121-Pyramimonas_sp.AAC.1
MAPTCSAPACFKMLCAWPASPDILPKTCAASQHESARVSTSQHESAAAEGVRVGGHKVEGKGQTGRVLSKAEIGQSRCGP